MAASASHPQSPVKATEVVLPGVGEPEVLEVRKRELPDPGPGQVIVRTEVSGVRAGRMLPGGAGVGGGKTIVVPGAAGGVGPTIVQLAWHAGVRVIGTAGPEQQERLRELGAVAVDYRNDDVPARVRELAPD